jgi:F-type H+-transporting ATPase subunit b|tara:strand:+ start:222 stop:797 length:576 start_codon:yes stop_codon:yes gene_type:complete
MRLFLITSLALTAIEIDLIAAEAGMPQLDPKYWASQVFWLILVFTILYICISRFFIPKIKMNLDDRENKIKEDLEEASSLKQLSEKKIKEYEIVLENAKMEVSKILLNSKNNLNKDIQAKRKLVEQEIEKEVVKAQKQILDLKKNSISSISNISEEITSKIIQDISGDELNKSSIKAAVSDISRKNLNKYL